VAQVGEDGDGPAGRRVGDYTDAELVRRAFEAEGDHGGGDGEDNF
jgi:hypothetical protein